MEEEFENNFGLHVQVFRKSGNVWVETNLTDNLTLAKQNEGEFELSHPLKKILGELEYLGQETE